MIHSNFKVELVQLDSALHLLFYRTSCSIAQILVGNHSEAKESCLST